MPCITVISTVLNEVNTIDGLLESILEQSLKPAEVVIVDGGSRDGTWEKLLSWRERFEQKGIKFKAIREEGANIARGRNLAIENASCELIASIDGGCIAHRDWLKELYAKYRKGVVVSGNFKPLAKTFVERVQAVFVRPSARDNPSSRSVLFEKEAWEKAGKYPEHLYTGEDTLFNTKLKEAGYNFVFAEKAVVYWRMRPSLLKWFRQFYLYGLGDALAGNLNLKTTYGKKLAVLLLLFYLSIALSFLFPQTVLLIFLLSTAYGLIRGRSVEGAVAGFLLPLRYLSFLAGFHAGIIKKLKRRVQKS